MRRPALPFLARCPALGASSLAAALLFSASAHAEVKQPDGTVIPTTDALKNALATEGETIEPKTQAAVTPETFDPACKLSFKVIWRGGGQKNSFGWYNVTGQKPALGDLYEFLGCDDVVGTTKVLSIREDPRYKKGRVAFFEATTQGKPGNCVKFGPTGPDPATLGYVFYSEKAWNEDSNFHLLILDSGKFKSSFYFGWEDLNQGNDNDFEDLLTRVDGIQCAGGGEVCDTGQKGVCGVGILQCKEGKLACLPQNQPKAETCNGIDDDCNGIVDDSDECSCTKGEFACNGGKTCESGVCVDPLCKGKTCKAGEICVGGTCKAPCAGVICPSGLSCRQDTCIDACKGVTCDADQVCDLGICKTKCQCGICEAGKTCAGSGKCVDTGCDAKTCDAGTVCKAGACVDACQGAVCPGGTACVAGACAPLSGTGGSGTGGSGITVGKGGAGGLGGEAAGGNGAAGKGGKTSKGGSKGSNDRKVTEEPDSGCGCRVAGSEGVSLAVPLGTAAAIVGLGLARRKRRAGATRRG